MVIQSATHEAHLVQVNNELWLHNEIVRFRNEITVGIFCIQFAYDLKFQFEQIRI